jgi:MarR family transcriptional regulator, lower aerobic nicotinate degradation pathway regulator
MLRILRQQSLCQDRKGDWLARIELCVNEIPNEERALQLAKKSVRKANYRPWPLLERPGFLIRRLHQIHVALFQEACGQFELTPLQYSLLSALAMRGTADQTTLAADITLDRTTTTGALKRLAARHLIERAVNKDDRRARLCRLTAAGSALLSKIERSAHAAHCATISELNKREQVQFIDMMQRIVAGHASRDSAGALLV